MKVISYYQGEIWLTGTIVHFGERTAVVKNDSNNFLHVLDINSLKVIEETNEDQETK